MAPRRQWPAPARGVAFGVLTALTLSCGERGLSPGEDPPNDALFFPHGMLLDPRASSEPAGACMTDGECPADYLCAAGSCREPASWMLVTNANSDIRYNGGSIVAVDLDGLFDAVGLDGVVGDSVGAQRVTLSEDTPCRRDALDTDLVECDERFFIDESATVHTGSFSLVPGGWNCEVESTMPADASGERPRTLTRHCGEDEARILLPVNGDPAIVWATLSGGGPGDAPTIDCGQGSEADPRRCGDDHRLRFLRNDEDSLPLAREMTNLLISPDRRYPLAYLTHASQGIGIPGLLTMVRLDGLSGVSEPGDPSIPVSAAEPTVATAEDPLPPAIIDIAALFSDAGSGGMGMAQRPCEWETAPVVTDGCSAPLVYAGYRWAAGAAERAYVASFTARRLRPSDLVSGEACVGPSSSDGTVECDEDVQAETLLRIDAGLAQVGDIRLSADGGTMYSVHSAVGGGTGPSALVRTTLGFDVFGRPIPASANAFAEICDRASSLTIYDDGREEYGLVSCYRTAQIFIVDLRTMTVINTALAGAGAHRMTVDLAREVVYVANTLDATISVIDMSASRPTRFRALARLGLSEPFGQ